MKNKKGFWLVLLTTLLLVAFAFTVSAEDAEIVASGNCGKIDYQSNTYSDDVQWYIDEKGVLSIVGNGVMTYPLSDLSRYVDVVDSVFIGSDVIIDESFYGKQFLEDGLSFIHPKRFVVDQNNTLYTTDSIGCLLSKDMSCLICYPSGLEKESFIVPEYVDTIFNRAFSQCLFLKSLNIPDTVKEVSWGWLIYCDNLETIRVNEAAMKVYPSGYFKTWVFGADVQTIDPSEIYSIYHAESYIVDENNPFFSSEDGVLFNKDKTVLIAYPGCNSRTEYIIPDSVTEIEEGAFVGSVNLEFIKLPNHLKTIPYGAFTYSSVSSIVLPQSVQYIGSQAFSCCLLLNLTVRGMTTVFDSDAVCSAFRLPNGTKEELKKLMELVAFGRIRGVSESDALELSERAEFYEDSLFYIGKIHCHSGSTAETYAKETGMDYELVHFYEDYVSTTAPTCTEQGYSTYKCIYCDETEKRDFVEPLDHDYIDHDALNPTCTEIGWDAYKTCSRCDYTTYEEKPANGHTEVVDEAIAATCTESGLTEGLHCSVCSDILVEQQIVPAHGHDFALSEIIDAKCSEDGQKIYVCKYDATHTRTETIPATGNHEDTDNDGKCDTCNQQMTGGQHCKYCGKIHGGAFGWLTKFFHSILAIFKR